MNRQKNDWNQIWRGFAGVVAVGVSLIFVAGCDQCMKLECQNAAPASLAPVSLQAAGNGKSISIQATTVDIPVTKNVKVCAGYEIMSKDVTSEGTALIVTVNGKQALSIDYQNDNGAKTQSAEIDKLLVPGKNDIAVVTVVFNTQFQGQELKTRAALVILADGKKIVDDCYPVPKAAYEPVTKSWTLTTQGTGGGGNPDVCPACHISQVEARWVVGIKPGALGVSVADFHAVSATVATRVKSLLGDGVQVLRYSPSGTFAVIKGANQGRIQEVKNLPEWVRYIEPDVVARVLDVGGPKLRPLFSTAKVKLAVNGTTPNDQQFAQQVYLPDINAPAAWAAGHKAITVPIAMVDTGANYNLDDLQGQITRGQDFACKQGDQVCDGNGHGTHVSGTILAKTDNTVGVAGVAWEGKLLVVRALDDAGNGNFSDICDGIRFAVDQGAKVISLSVGAPINKNEVPQVLIDTAKYAMDKGVVLVCAAANDNRDNDADVRNYPSSLELPNIIGVLATNTGARTKASFSNFGPGHVHIAAPGTDILNLWPDGTYRYLNGTSMATPQVSAALAICWNDLGANLKVEERIAKFLETQAVAVPGLVNYCKDGKFLQMK